MTTLLIIAPFFAVIACGYFATWRRIINSGGRSGLNQFVYYFALPVLIFSLMANADLRGEFQWLFVAAWLCASLVLFATALLIARLVFRLQFSFGVVFATASIYGNTGYFGLPFVIIAFGQEASVPVIVCTTIDLAVMLPLASVLIERSQQSARTSFFQMTRNATQSVAANPLIVAVFLGALFSLSEFALPDAVERFVSLLGSAAAPCALFALGSSLVEDSLRTHKSQTLAMSILKLIVHPALVWLSMFHLFPINAEWAVSAVFAAAMPVAVTVYVLSQQFNAYTGRTSASILISTVISVATLSFVISTIT